MARPTRCRRICFEPRYGRFAPCGTGETEQVLLTIDEFEAVRLIDREGRTHAQCARQMGVSRTTITEMYERARMKIADCIVNGKTLCISGGNYALCNGPAENCCGMRCIRTDERAEEQAMTRTEVERMKIAVTYENGDVFPHFGHTEHFKVYEVEDGKVVDAQVVSTEGSGHGALAGLLSGMKVDLLICGGIGAGAQAALADAKIRLYGGVSGRADEAVEAFLAGRLSYDPNVHCDHHKEGHHHGEGHSCGGNGGSCH